MGQTLEQSEPVLMKRRTKSLAVITGGSWWFYHHWASRGSSKLFSNHIYRCPLTLSRPLLPYGYSESCAGLGYAVRCNFWHPDTLTLSCIHMETVGVKGFTELCM